MWTTSHIDTYLPSYLPRGIAATAGGPVTYSLHAPVLPLWYGRGETIVHLKAPAPHFESMLSHLQKFPLLKEFLFVLNTTFYKA